MYVSFKSLHLIVYKNFFVLLISLDLAKICNRVRVTRLYSCVILAIEIQRLYIHSCHIGIVNLISSLTPMPISQSNNKIELQIEMTICNN
jgi:hypothetical protein